jgi:hypothetical protein
MEINKMWIKLIGTGFVLSMTIGFALALYDPNSVGGSHIKPIRIGGAPIWIHHVGWGIIVVGSLMIVAGFLGLIWEG